MNPATPIKVDSPLNSPTWPLFPSRTLRPAARMKSLLDRGVKRPRSSSPGSGLVPPPGPCRSEDAPPRPTCQPEIWDRSHSLTIHGAPISPTGSPIRRPMALARAARLNTRSPRGPFSHRTGFRIGLSSLRQNSWANNPQSSKKPLNLA